MYLDKNIYKLITYIKWYATIIVQERPGFKCNINKQ